MKQLLRKKRARREASAGFLYVELMISFFMLAVALLAFVPLCFAAIWENAAASDLTFAAAAAQDKAERLKMEEWLSLADGADTLFLRSMRFVRTWDVEDDTPHPGMRRVTVTVTPQRSNPDGVRPAVVRFYRAR